MAKADNLLVADIFCSIQGEGKRLGTPSVFLRLGICNLQCVWCDTPYTWKKGFTDYRSLAINGVLQTIQALRHGKNIGGDSADEVMKKLELAANVEVGNGRGAQKSSKLPVQNLVITGGEPLLQQSSLIPLLRSPLLKDMEVEFETNGSMELFPAMKALMKKRKISFNISPKLADSGNSPYPVHIYPNSVLKFVYTGKKSEELIDAFLKKYGDEVRDVPIYIMPEGVTVEDMEKKYTNILAYCLKRGYRFTPRLHIYLFGNQRAT